VGKTVCFYSGLQMYAVPAFVIIKNANQDKSGFHSPYFPCVTHIFWMKQEQCKCTLSQEYPKF